MANLVPIGYKAGILDQDNVELYFVTHAAVSSDPSIVSIIDAGAGTIGVRRWLTGPATITSTRLADGATSDLDVEEPDPVPLPTFETHLGQPAVPA